MSAPVMVRKSIDWSAVRTALGDSVVWQDDSDDVVMIEGCSCRTLFEF
ncbi:hypothetical protein [Rhodococcoides yunnanense]|uniref:Uncharacterized protein n=1 Tax=Rhodococcoides yunnanense TaxID=278209 RepID=A0ABU4BDP9_9NOCA|nr:hypothetical protein [Rhodococcus yunnanensis]MDV6262337.1 hypothetical protein [Rhodococcus yunnanensis]